jgi:hypothetical protein
MDKTMEQPKVLWTFPKNLWEKGGPKAPMLFICSVDQPIITGVA